MTKKPHIIDAWLDATQGDAKVIFSYPSTQKQTTKNDALKLAKLFHTTYERLAPEFGYETRTDTKVFDPLSSNGRLMLAVCSEILALEEQELPNDSNTY